MTPLIAAAVWFDGLGGALIGAGATIAVVVFTIRHDSNARQADRLEQAIQQANHAIGVCGMTLSTSGLTSETYNAGFQPALLQVQALIATARRTEPELAELLGAAAKNMTDIVESFGKIERPEVALRDSLLRFQVAIGFWMSGPDQIRHGLIGYPLVADLTATADNHGTVKNWQPPQVTWRDRINRVKRRSPIRAFRH